MRLAELCKSVWIGWCCGLFVTHLLPVPRLSLGPAAVGDIFILSTDLSNDGVHVQAAAVVHLHNNRGVLDLALQLTKFLQMKLIKKIIVIKIISISLRQNVNPNSETVKFKNDVQPHRRPWGSWSHPGAHQPWLQVPPCSCRQHQHPGKKSMCHNWTRYHQYTLLFFVISRKDKEIAPSSGAQTRSLQLHVCWFHLHTCWNKIEFSFTSGPFSFASIRATLAGLHQK